jgi:hypothetical protein
VPKPFSFADLLAALAAIAHPRSQAERFTLTIRTRCSSGMSRARHASRRQASRVAEVVSRAVILLDGAYALGQRAVCSLTLRCL